MATNLFNRNFVSTLVLAGSLVVSAAAQGGAPAGGAPTSSAPAAGPTGNKVAIINIQAAIVNTAEGQREANTLTKRFEPKQNELKAQRDEVENLQKQLTAQESKLSEDEKATRARSLEAKQKSLQRNFEDAQNDFQAAQQEVVNRIGGKMLQVIDKYARDNGYAVVLDVSNPQSNVLWAAQGIDITRQVVDAYNAANPGGGAATGAAAGGAGAPAAPSAARPAGQQQQRPPQQGQTQRPPQSTQKPPQ